MQRILIKNHFAYIENRLSAIVDRRCQFGFHFVVFFCFSLNSVNLSIGFLLLLHLISFFDYSFFSALVTARYHIQKCVYKMNNSHFANEKRQRWNCIRRVIERLRDRRKKCELREREKTQTNSYVIINIKRLRCGQSASKFTDYNANLF